jgi:hypothetical protein
METYIVTALDQLSGYTDVFKVRAESASHAVEVWSNQQSELGITTEYRWPNPRACKLEHFNPIHVRTDNMPANMRHSGNVHQEHPVVSFSDLTSKERQEYLEWIQIERNWDKEFADNIAEHGIPF